MSENSLSRQEAEATLCQLGLTTAQATALVAKHLDLHSQTMPLTPVCWRDTLAEVAKTRPLHSTGDTPKALAARLARMGNGLSHRACIEEFVEALHHEHRTLQQLVTRIFCAWLESLAQLTHAQYDLRNQAAVEFAKIVVRQVPLEKRQFPFF